ncbi:MAG: MBL fold metallo-hydrolase [Clostridiales bacterium]|nr:MBL fold metallo-hydrolase [Clostridiales bacterium]
MREICHNLFEEKITYSVPYLSPRNLYVLKQPGRSLMIDTSMNQEPDRRILFHMLEELNIRCEDLDVFITHNHPDHIGLVPDLQEKGARILMNPDEIIHPIGLSYDYLSDVKCRDNGFRLAGVTPELTPVLYKNIMAFAEEQYKIRGKSSTFSFEPVYPGGVLRYPEYHFRLVLLRGHTYGQCGLYEPDKRLFFCGDQLMTTIVPIVDSQEADLNMLHYYLDSLLEMKSKYGHCDFLSCHFDPIRDVDAEVERIAHSYMDKCSMMRDVLREEGRPMTTREISEHVYGKSGDSMNFGRYALITMIWSKSLSCLDYLYGEGLIERTRNDGTLFWSLKPRR